MTTTTAYLIAAANDLNDAATVAIVAAANDFNDAAAWKSARTIHDLAEMARVGVHNAVLDFGE